MIDKLRLNSCRKTLIGGTLMKGVSGGERKRTSIGYELIKNPSILMLDEPTSGLDPNQLVEIRSLIKQIGEEKTVIFSTHIMQEVQALCDRVVIINKGDLVANDSIDTLTNRVTGERIVTIEFVEKVNKSSLNKIKGVTRVEKLTDNKWKLASDLKTDIRPMAFHFAVAEKLTLIEMSQETVSIENIFQQLTK